MKYIINNRECRRIIKFRIYDCPTYFIVIKEDNHMKNVDELVSSTYSKWIGKTSIVTNNKRTWNTNDIVKVVSDFLQEHSCLEVDFDIETAIHGMYECKKSPSLSKDEVLNDVLLECFPELIDDLSFWESKQGAEYLKRKPYASKLVTLIPETQYIIEVFEGNFKNFEELKNCYFSNDMMEEYLVKVFEKTKPKWFV